MILNNLAIPNYPNFYPKLPKSEGKMDVSRCDVRTFPTQIRNVLLFLGLCQIGCFAPDSGGGKTGTPPGERGKIEWSDKAVVGDVTVELKWSASMLVSQEPYLMSMITLTNTSRTKLVEFGGWYLVPVEDEHGNRYKAVSVSRWWNGSADPKGATRVEEWYRPSRITLYPGKSYHVFYAHTPPVDATTEVRWTLDAGELGGVGKVHLRVPLSRQ